MTLDWRAAAERARRRVDPRNVAEGAVAGLGIAIAIGVMEWLSLAIIPFATSIALVIGSPDAEPAQPRALIGGHWWRRWSGLRMVKLTGPSAWAAAVAVGLAILGHCAGSRASHSQTLRSRRGPAGQTGRRREQAPRCAHGRRSGSTDARSTRSWCPAIFPQAAGRVRPPKVHRAMRSPRRGTDIAGRAAAPAQAQGAAARRATASGSSAPPHRAAAPAPAAPPRSRRP